MIRKTEVLVIGGGPAGLMAAIAAAETGAEVLIVDKGDKLGRKLAISGGGRCNVTNRLPVDEIVKNIPGNGKFLYSAFSIFNNEDIIRFFEKLGVKLKEEDNGRMFPANDDAKSVVNALIRRLKELKVVIQTRTKVIDIEYEKGRVAKVLLQDGGEIRPKAVVVAVGGKSVPHTGSTGDGYPWAEKAGHTITELFPTEVPIVSDEPFIKERKLQGLSLRNAALSVLDPKGKPVITHRMDLIFTHFGVSGPAALRCSQFVVKGMKKWKLSRIEMNLDALPERTEEEIFLDLQEKGREQPKKAVKNLAKEWVPERYAAFLLERCGILPETPFHSLSKEKCREFSRILKNFRFFASGTQPLEKAFVTGGGVSVKEIDPKTMASKKMQGLYFCGEILDIHGYTGGFNITAALVTGRLAGMSAGTYAKE